jgi:uncharacterized protein (TIGR00251 family)
MAMEQEDFYTLKNESLLINVKVIPNAGRSRVTGVKNGELCVRLGAQPERGKANKELLRFLAKELGLPRKAVELAAGQTSRHKRVRLPGAAAGKLKRLAGRG